MSHDVPFVLQLIGRMHVMLVHLPIGFLVLLAALEGLGTHSKLKHATTSNRIIFGLTVPVITVSAACGWVLAWCNSDYDTQTLFWHRWSGTALVPLGILLWWLHWRDHLIAYRTCLISTVVLLVVVGHYGASLTHGSDYLFPRANTHGEPAVNYADLMEKPVYAAVVQPFLNDNCISCHGPNKSKGGLRLDTTAFAFHGGEDGGVIVPGDATHSDLIRRMLTPLDSDDHMPPSGKRQPTASDVALLEWWINAGAPTNKTVAQLNPPSDIVRLLQSKGQSSAK